VRHPAAQAFPAPCVTLERRGPDRPAALKLPGSRLLGSGVDAEEMKRPA
jgi:hypothetical protein